MLDEGHTQASAPENTGAAVVCASAVKSAGRSAVGDYPGKAQLANRSQPSQALANRFPNTEIDFTGDCRLSAIDAAGALSRIVKSRVRGPAVTNEHSAGKEKAMMKRMAIQIGVFGAAFMAMTVLANAQGLDIGKREYENNCATCHGADGKGKGPLAGMINQVVPDLTVIQKNNDGKFPFVEIYATIDGTKTTGAHGTRDMPAWGQEYRTDAPTWCGELSTVADQQAFVRGRILALIGYVQTLQEM